ncbi:MAG: hypothetical protein NVS4B13_04120 [Candidatus Elarobacter sp.]
MTGRVNAVLRLRSNADGSIAITLTSPCEDEPLAVDDSALVVTVWSESPDVIRGRFVDEGSGAVAYFQSSGPSLRTLGKAIHFIGPRGS